MLTRFKLEESSYLTRGSASPKRFQQFSANQLPQTAALSLITGTSTRLRLRSLTAPSQKCCLKFRLCIYYDYTTAADFAHLPPAKKYVLLQCSMQNILMLTAVHIAKHTDPQYLQNLPLMQQIDLPLQTRTGLLIVTPFTTINLSAMFHISLRKVYKIAPLLSPKSPHICVRAHAPQHCNSWSTPQDPIH